jgi:hypothetical protein
MAFSNIGRVTRGRDSGGPIVQTGRRSRDISADYSEVSGSRGGISPWQRYMRDREIEKNKEEQAAAEAMVVNRLEDEKKQQQIQQQLNKAQADQAQAVQSNLEKEAASTDVGKKEANIASRVQEYDEKRAEAVQQHEDRQGERQADFESRESARQADLDANREQRAIEKAESEARAMAERISVHEQRQKLSQEKERSAALAKPKGRRTAEELSEQGVPVPATQEPFIVPEQDRELASAVRMGATDGWVQKRARQILEEDAPSQRTAMPPRETPFREPTKGKVLEDYGPATLAAGRGDDYELSAEKEWLKSAGPAEYRAYEAWKAGEGPRPSSLPQEAAPTPPVAPAAPRQASSGRTADVAPSTRSAGLGSSTSSPASSSAPTPLQAARARQPVPPPATPQRAPMPAPPTPSPAAVPGPVSPGVATPSGSHQMPDGSVMADSAMAQPASIQAGLEAGLPGLAQGAPPAPLMPFAPPQTKEVIPAYGPAPAIEIKGGGDTPDAYLGKVNEQAAQIAKSANPQVAENFIYTKQREVLGGQQADMMREARKVVSNAIGQGMPPEQAVALGQAHVKDLLAEADQKTQFEASQWFDPSPRGIASFAARLGPPLVVGVLTQSWPFMAAAGLAGSLVGQQIAKPDQPFSLEETLADTAGAALNTGLATKVAGKLGGGRLAQTAGTAAQGFIENLGVEQGRKALTQGELLTPAEALMAGGSGAALGGAVGYGMSGVLKNLHQRAVNRGAADEAVRLEALAKGIDEGDPTAIELGALLQKGASLDEAVLSVMARNAEPTQIGKDRTQGGIEGRFAKTQAEAPKGTAEELLAKLQQQAAPPEQPRINEGPSGKAVSTVDDVRAMFPRADFEDLGGGRVRVSGQGLQKPLVVELGKADVELKPGTMEATRGAAEMQPGEYVAARTETTGPEGKIEVRAGEGRETAMHEVTHAIEALTARGDLAKGDLNALNAKARFRALAEARRRGLKWNELSGTQQQNLLAEARADMVGEFSQIKGEAPVADTPLGRALAKVRDFTRELSLARLGTRRAHPHWRHDREHGDPRRAEVPQGFGHSVRCGVSAVGRASPRPRARRRPLCHRGRWPFRGGRRATACGTGEGSTRRAGPS